MTGFFFDISWNYSVLLLWIVKIYCRPNTVFRMDFIRDWDMDENAIQYLCHLQIYDKLKMV